MANTADPRLCDFCGRSESEIFQQNSGAAVEIRLDEDSLWVCGLCQSSLKTLPTPEAGAEELDPRLRKLVGTSAGIICRREDLPFAPPYQTVMEAASRIAYDEDRYMSAWMFVSQWMDGTTIWQSADRSARALVEVNGTVVIEEL